MARRAATTSCGTGCSNDSAIIAVAPSALRPSLRSTMLRPASARMVGDRGDHADAVVVVHHQHRPGQRQLDVVVVDHDHPGLAVAEHGAGDGMAPPRTVTRLV